jgi:DNA invertase Pin-like site-specific DNA recombinase
LSKDEITVRCTGCHQEWTLRIKTKEQSEFDCPFCARTFRVTREDPLSIQSQTDICRSLAEQKLPREIARGMEVFADINVSGEVPIRERPNGAKIMEKLRAGDWLFIPLLDRGFRHLGDWCYQAEFFRKNKINLVVGDFPDVDLNDPMSEMWLNLMAMFAQWYRQQVSRHTKRGLAKLKSMGRPHSGSVPRGYSLRCTECQRIY